MSTKRRLVFNLKAPTDARELIYQTVKRVLAQGGRSIGNGTCQYRLQSEGKVMHCALGIWIDETPEMYSPFMEGSGLDIDRVNGVMFGTILGYGESTYDDDPDEYIWVVNHPHVSLLADLQAWHDTAAHWSPSGGLTENGWEYLRQHVASDYELGLQLFNELVDEFDVAGTCPDRLRW